MVYPAMVQIGLGLPTAYTHSHMPTRNFSPYSTQSVRLNIPHIPHLDPPSSPFPNNEIRIDIGSWSRDVGLSIRTESSPPSSEFSPTVDSDVEESSLAVDPDFPPPMSPSNSDEVEYTPLVSPSDSDNHVDVDSTPRASGRLNGHAREPSNTPHIKVDSPSHYSDTSTVCYRPGPNANDTASQPNIERIITPLPATTIHTTQDAGLAGVTNIDTSRTGLNPKSKSVVAVQSQDTARRIVKCDRTSGEYTYIDEPLSGHIRNHYQTTIPPTPRGNGVYHGQCPSEAALAPLVVPVNRLHGPPTNPPPGPKYNHPPGLQLNLPPGLPINCHPVQYAPPPGLPVNLPPRFWPGPPPGFPPHPYNEPRHQSIKPVDKSPHDPYLDFEHVVPKSIKDYWSGHVDIHPHNLDRFIPTETPESRLPISIEEPISPLPVTIPKPVEPTSPGSPLKTIYMIRAGKGRSALAEAKARSLHIPYCLDIPIGILGYNPSLSPLGKSQVEDLCKQTTRNIQARAQLLVTSPQRRALRTTAGLFPLCRRLFKPNMVPVCRPIKALGLLNDTRAKPRVSLDLLAALCPDPRAQLYFRLKFDYTQINAYTSTFKDSAEHDCQDPLREVRERAKAMRQWLWDRPETVIVVVSHNDFMHHMVDFGEQYTKWDHCQIREFTMFIGVEGYGPSMAEVPLDIRGPPREAPKSLPERIDERKLMCHVEESC